MLSFLLSLVNPLSAIADKIAAAYLAKQKAQTDQEKIAADERIKALEARRDVMLAEAGQRTNGLIRAGFALPFLIYNAKLVLWDKVLSLGSTDPLSAELMQIQMICIGFYFLHSIVDRIKR